MLKSRKVRQRGQALMIAIGLVAFLSALATAYLMMSWSQTRQLAALSGRIAAVNAADAAANLAIWRLSNTWRSSPASALAGEYYCEEEGAAVHVSMINESALINLNLASARSMQTALEGAGFAAGTAGMLAERIADYVDRDDRTVDGELEVNAYRQGAKGFRQSAAPKNSRIDLPEELLIIPGVDEGRFARIRTVLTIYSTRSGFAPSFAAPATDNGDSQEIGNVYRIIARAETPSGNRALRDVVVAFTTEKPNTPEIMAWRESRERDLSVIRPGNQTCRALFQ